MLCTPIPLVLLPTFGAGSQGNRAISSGWVGPVPTPTVRAGYRIRTGDIFFTREVLYLLS